MRLLVSVNSGPWSGLAGSAFQFVDSALSTGHQVMRVFFYHEGVLNGLESLTVTTDAGTTAVHRWQDLAARHDLDLVLCVGAALRRGVMDVAMTDEYGGSPNLAEPFRIAGLGQWFDAVVEADRVVRFGPGLP